MIYISSVLYKIKSQYFHENHGEEIKNYYAFFSRSMLMALILICISSQLRSQFTLKHDIQQVHDKYLHLNNAMINVDYNMYANDTTTEILESKGATVYKNKDFQVQEFMGNQTWYLNNHTIVIMPSDKKVVLSDPVLDLSSSVLAGLSLDSILVAYKAVRREENGKAVFHLDFPENINTPYSTMDITVGDNGLYDKIVLQCRLPLSYFGICSECENSYPRLELIFSYKTTGFIMPDVNPLLASIQKENNQYSLVGEYRNYRLVNLKYKN